MFIDFKPWHLDKMRFSDEIRDFIGKFPTKRNLERLAAHGLAFTSIGEEPDGVKLLGVLGANPQSRRKAEVFLIMSKDGKRLMRELVKDTRRVLSVAHERFAIIEALGDDTPRINRWLAWLGFKRGPMVSSNKFMWRLV